MVTTQDGKQHKAFAHFEAPPIIQRRSEKNSERQKKYGCEHDRGNDARA
jgi:hypothetical protein